MKKLFLTCLSLLLVISCPPPPQTEDVFKDVNIATFFTFAEGDSAAGVTQPFNFSAKDGFTISVKAPSSLEINNNTVNIHWYAIESPTQSVTLTATLSKEGQSKSFPFEVTLLRKLGKIDPKTLITFGNENDSFESVTENFTVSSDTSPYDETLTWSVPTEYAAYLSIDGSGLVTISKVEGKTTQVQLKATFSKEGFKSVEKTIDLTLADALLGYAYLPQPEEVIQLHEKDYLFRVRQNFQLIQSLAANSEHGEVTVKWEILEGNAISIDNSGNATVTRTLDSQKVVLQATFSEEGKLPISRKVDLIVMETIPESLTIDGKTYKLVYYDAFDNQDIFEANWDLGNPGYDANEDVKNKMGHTGGNPTYFKAPDGQFHGYANELQKQPTWSPRASYIEDGKARLIAKYDSSVGVGICGGIHSKRYFPHGVFHARWTQIRNKNTHWDAFWLDTNEPFSKAYGQKILNLPKALRSKVTQDSTLGEGFFDNKAANIQHGNTAVSDPVLIQSQYTLKTDASKSWDFVAAPRVDKKGRWYNAEQRYELDAYEWVNGNGQNNVIHTWHWMRGYPSNTTGTTSGVSNIYYVGDVARGQGKIGGYSTTYTRNVNNTPSFTLTCLYNSSKISFYYNGHGEESFTSPTFTRSSSNGIFDTGQSAENQQPWPDDEFNPVQAKFTIEPGQWNDNFWQVTTEQGNAIDYMDLEYYAYYAAADDLVNPNIGNESGQPLTPITDLDNIQETAETQAKLTKEWKK